MQSDQLRLEDFRNWLLGLGEFNHCPCFPRRAETVRGEAAGGREEGREGDARPATHNSTDGGTTNALLRQRPMRGKKKHAEVSITKVWLSFTCEDTAGGRWTWRASSRMCFYLSLCPFFFFFFVPIN